MPHYLQFNSNMMNPSRILRCMVESEEIGHKNTKEKELSGNFEGLRKFATYKFRRLRNFAACEISQVANFRNLRTLLTCVPVDCFLTRLFGGFIQVFPHVILVL